MPRMLRRARSPLVVSAIVVGGFGPVAAQLREEAINVRYEAPTGCGSAETFFAELAQRAPVRRVDTATRSFEIAITQDPTGITHGALTIRTAEGDTVRAVDGASCEETIAALVVVASLAVTAGREITPVPPPPPRPTPSLVPAEHWLAIGSGLGWHLGVVPESTFGMRAFVGIGRTRGRQLRLGIARTQEQPTMVAVGASEFRWTVGRVELRPIVFARGPFELAPSFGVEVGALTARGTQVASPAGGSRPWVAPSVAALVGLRVNRFTLELEGGLAAPLVRDRFFIAPGTTVHQVPVITGGVSLALIVEVL